ncbi:hypothetical protein LTR09_002007 [Extremus antarcticus]|uniref:Uncharacterized protein n=1 Tax=Extremus antarcticus TaxID=702011 RepID=A0AAJ0LVE2_9PEZI|nr:hypothetical protein LTR09_002007 [Extremus antarcticus]
MSTLKSSENVAAGHGERSASAIAPKVRTGQSRTGTSSRTSPIASDTTARERSPSTSSTSSGRYPEEPPRPQSKKGVVLRDPWIEESPMETMEKYLTHTTHFGVDPELARKWYMFCFDKALRWQLLEEKDEPTEIAEMHSN